VPHSEGGTHSGGYAWYPYRRLCLVPIRAAMPGTHTGDHAWYPYGRSCLVYISTVNDIGSFGMIVFEDLHVKNMLQNHCLAKSIADAAWNQLITYTTYKAENAGRRVVSVDPRNTSKQCSGCGTMVEKSLSVRVHQCPVCGLVMDRDENASHNILRLGLESLGYALEAPALLRGE